MGPRTERRNSTVTGAFAGAEEAAIRATIQGAADAGHIDRWAVPERIVLVDAFEKTSVGKIDKKRLRVRYADIEKGPRDQPRS